MTQPSLVLDFSSWTSTLTASLTSTSSCGSPWWDIQLHLLRFSKLYTSHSSRLFSVTFRCCPDWIWCVTARVYACKSPRTYESGFSASARRATPTKTDNLPGGRRKRDSRMMTSSRFSIKSRKAPQTKTSMALTVSLPQTNIREKCALFYQVWPNMSIKTSALFFQLHWTVSHWIKTKSLDTKRNLQNGFRDQKGLSQVFITSNRFILCGNPPQIIVIVKTWR